jgi:cytochrome c oxidase cbb3-type subunit III
MINSIGRRACVGGPLLLLAGLIVGCDFPGEPKPQEAQAVAAAADSFATLYATNCSGCHGPDGKMGPAPPLNDPLFLAIVPSDVIESVIRDGRPGTLMPAFSQKKGGTLNSRQVSILASELRSHWLPGGAEMDHLPPYLADPKRERADGTLQQGLAAFTRSCAGCHGSKGEGDSAGPIADPAFLALLSDQALRRLIITGRPDLGMPTYAQKEGRDDNYRPLTSAEIDELVAFVRHLGKAEPATARRDRPVGRVSISSLATSTRRAN